MKTIAALIATALLAGCTTSKHTLTVTPEIKKAFHSGDAIKIRSVTGTAPKFQIGGTYRVVGTCRQQTLKNATLPRQYCRSRLGRHRRQHRLVPLQTASERYH